MTETSVAALKQQGKAAPKNKHQTIFSIKEEKKLPTNFQRMRIVFSIMLVTILWMVRNDYHDHDENKYSTIFVNAFNNNHRGIKQHHHGEQFDTKRDFGLVVGLSSSLLLSSQQQQQNQGHYEDESSTGNSIDQTTTTTTGNSSVRDQVLNLHGGKYNFDDPALTMNAVGREFAQSLYSSSSTTTTSEDDTNMKQDEDEWPNWAKRMITTLPSTVHVESSSSSDENQDFVVIQGLSQITMQPLQENSMDLGAIITVQNQFSTWEPYFSKIIQLRIEKNDNDNTSKVSVVPTDSTIDEEAFVFEIVGKSCGTLAPQGGSTNLCDANNPYLDSTKIRIRYVGQEIANGGSNNNNNQYCWCLAAGTEEEKWYYHLLTPSSKLN
mmetsp:Transcript_1722/g.2378  ORF Transcript_1722/g.2378 Transcript_1722/m.2378 type:complete len:380 (-) Transcript_1722:2072-3211(-)